ncbi:MAG TPA: hypothetical protein VIB38_02915 [Aestuariivirgaceae bacterium]|jgi:ferritin-like metal-binding protein YciE
MSQTATSLLSAALRNARAMETRALALLKHRAGRLEQFPELQCEAAVQRSIAPLLQESLKEEEAMARWLKENIQRLTRDHVSNCERSAAAA